jgi:predicted Zn-dependent peptidase
MAITQSNHTSSVRKTILENGLTLLVKEDQSALVVSAQGWCRAGSVTKGRWMGAGLSHVLEHMLFKGTTTRGVAQIAQEIEDKGGCVEQPHRPAQSPDAGQRGIEADGWSRRIVRTRV